jgi:pimeloyl-ACP methyl ester carboxylesterase
MTSTDPQRVSFAGAGITLAGDRRGERTGRPVLLLHGGGQTRHAWNGTANALAARGFDVVTIDLRGHGETDWAPGGVYRSQDFIADVDAVVGTFAQKPIVIGASLGGMLLLVLEGDVHPGATAGIVLVDIAHETRQQGVDRILDFMESGASGFASLEEAADAVAAYLSHRKRPENTDGLRKNLRQHADGRWYWHWDPRMLQNMDLEEARTSGLFVRAAANINVPTLLVRGRESDVVDDTIAHGLLALIPHARDVNVADAQHMVAGDANDAFTNAIVAFCESVPQAEP